MWHSGPVRGARALLACSLFLTACGPTNQAAPGGAAAPGAAAPTAAAQPQTQAQPAAAAQASGSLVFFSNQFKPVEEQGKMQDIILKNAPVKADYIPEDPGPFNDRLVAEEKAGKVTVSLIGGLHGDLDPFVKAGYLEDLTAVAQKLNDRGIAPAFMDLAHLGAKDKTYYIPWMQATYVLAINKKALQYLPQGADVNALTYTQLKDWGAAIQKATNKRMLGFPAGPKGLLHRFFQGYLYPSYTGSPGVVAFKTPEARAMWQEFKDTWQYVNPQSTNYEFMQEPLASEEVWIAWDHVARLINVAKDRPTDFVLVPAPAGAKGRGFMPVLAGLAIPKGAPNRVGAEQLIDYLTQPAQQSNTAAQLAFFPVTNAPVPSELNPGIKLESDAVQKQSSSKDALVSLLPIGLGAKGGDFNNVFLDTFQRIVLKNEDVQTVLDAEAKSLQGIMDDTKASCWAPDPPSDGPCKVK
ncbi:MAG TPA: ABC transporter substrate-binding protein [Chloroflexota bacterium]|jgi:multiple sugar transport system substrate-binding protein|nr:ABC transporter substrate-binding protein [Chloroflexota bacterium]